MKLSKKTIFLLLAIFLVIAFVLGRNFLNRQVATTYQSTATVEKGTLVLSVSATGQVSTANSAAVNTEASGVIKEIYVKNGQTVQAGDKIAEVDLDLQGQQRSTQALASYQNAKINLDTANTALYSLQSDMLTKWKTYMDTAQNTTYQNSDNSPNTASRALPQFVSTSDDWLATEAKYKTQQSVINQAQVSLSSAWNSYQQASSTIYAPISGVLTGLALQVGSVINTQTASSGSSVTQKIASIKTDAAPVVSTNLTEVDAPKVKIGDKATLTFDAFPGKTYTGKVMSIDFAGSVSSGVTTYLATIAFDTKVDNIFPNMSVSAKIITGIKNNVLLLSSSAIQTLNGTSTVQLITNDQLTQTQVETGDANDTQTEIKSGLKEGDVVAVGLTTNTSSTSQTSSPFGGLGSRGFGGAALRGR